MNLLCRHAVIDMNKHQCDVNALPMRDAASLIIVRDMGGAPQVLVGRRAASNRFMPGIYVFPGGVLQSDDFTAITAGQVDDAWVKPMAVRGSRAMANALANTAIRETAEETGLLLGEVGDIGEVGASGWRAFRAAKLQPSLQQILYLGRAITPRSMSLRFNARFFVVAHSALHGSLTNTEELDDLQWITLAPRQELSHELPHELPMVDITKYILRHFSTLLQHAKHHQPFVFRHHRGRVHVRRHQSSPITK